MSIVIAIKVLGEICLYFGILSCSARLRGLSLLFAITAFCCSIAVGMARKFAPKRGMQLLMLLILAFPYLLTGLQLKALISISAAILYAAALIITDRLEVDEWTFAIFYKIVSFLIILLSVVYAAIGDDWGYFFRFSVVYIVTGAAVIRQMRIGTNRGRQFESVNYLTYLCGLFAGGIGAGIITFLIAFSGKILEIILTPIGMLLKWLSGLFIFLDKQIPDLQETWETIEETVESLEDTYEINRYQKTEMTEPTPGMASDAVLLKALAVIAIIVVACFALYLIFILVKGTRETIIGEDDEVTYETMKYEVQKRKKVREKKGNKEKIRLLYKKSLSQMKRQGVRISQKDTTEEILEKDALYMENEAARELRDLYISVRYQDDSQVPDEAVSKARKLAKEVMGLRK